MKDTYQNIYEKLAKLRESVKKEMAENIGMYEAADKKAKSLKMLMLYSYLENVATLKVVNLENIDDMVVFQLPVMHNQAIAKETLYSMALDIDVKQEITVSQYLALIDKMKEKKVNMEDVLKRYCISDITEMTSDVFERCMRVISRMGVTQ